MFFQIEERRAWVRTHTHTIVYDRDSEFDEHAQNPTGSVQRMLRIWLSDTARGRVVPRAYLGWVSLCEGRAFPGHLRRLYRRLTEQAPRVVEHPRALRRKLSGALRDHFGS
jgi:hypothetical protein